MRTREEQVAELTGVYEDAGVFGQDAKDQHWKEARANDPRGNKGGPRESGPDLTRGSRPGARQY